jgi:hypothetical protein
MSIELLRKRLSADRASFIEPCLPSPADKPPSGASWHRYVVELPPVLTKVEWQEKYGLIDEPTAALPTGPAARQF